MLKKIIQFVILITLYIFLALGQFSFINSLDNFWQFINIGVIVASFLIFLFDLPTALIFVFVYAFVLDLFSFQFFSFHLLALLFSIILSHILIKRFFTNKSLYSFLSVTSLNLLLYNLFSAFLLLFKLGFSEDFVLFSNYFWLALGYQLIWGLIIASLFFNLALSVVKKFKPFFLEKNL